MTHQLCQLDFVTLCSAERVINIAVDLVQNWKTCDATCFKRRLDLFWKRF